MSDGQKLLEYKLDLTEAIVTQILNTMAEERKSKSELFSEELGLSILASLTLNIVLRALQAPTEGLVVRDDDKGVSDTHANYREMKASVEEAVASAFSAAFSEFNNGTMPVDFTCEIDPWVDPKTTKAH